MAIKVLRIACKLSEPLFTFFIDSHSFIQLMFNKNYCCKKVYKMKEF